MAPPRAGVEKTTHFGQYFEMSRSEDIVDRDLAIFAHGVVNINEFASFLPFLASDTKVCKPKQNQK